MQQKRRLTGIDLLRGIAIFAVVLLHSDEGIQVSPAGWAEILSFSGFAVPFFLATAFYLSVGRLYTSTSPFPLKARLERLLVPYAIWTIIYLAYKSLKFWVAGESDQVVKIYQDPIALIFFGGAAFHLYFLPLLASGTPLVKVAERLIRWRLRFLFILAAAIGSLVLYGLLLSTGNGFQLGSNVAFQPLIGSLFPQGNQNLLIRLVTGLTAWMLRCLPYILIAMVLTHPVVKERFLKACDRFLVGWVCLFLIVNLFGAAVLPAALHEVARGYLTLLLAISLSNRLPDSSIISSLGTHSFGIYLIHLLFVEAVQIVANRLYPAYVTQVSTPILLGVSLFSFMISWLASFLLMKQKTLSRVLFGA